MKVCTRCHEEKPHSEFYYKNTRGIRYPECKVCTRARVKRRYQKKHKEIIAYITDWRNKNRDRFNASARKRHRERRSVDLEYCISCLMTTKRAQCRRWKITFEIDTAFVMALFNEQQGRCALTGRELIWGKKGLHRDTISIDRVDQTKGYERGNVRLVTFQVNRARSRLSDDELLALAEAIVYTLKDAKRIRRRHLRLVAG